jgi:hypothetical protein
MHALILFAALQGLPAGPVMKGALADPREPRVAVGFVMSTLLADDFVARPGQDLPSGLDAANDAHAVVQLGTDFPLLRVGAVLISIQGSHISRFRLEASDNDHLSSDYLVAFPVSYRHGEWEGRLRLMHRSGHLGDELVLGSTLRRLEFDHEEIDALVARRVGPLRVYVGGTLTLASSFDRDKGGWQVGLDGERDIGRGWSVEGGLDYQRHAIQLDGRSSVLAGLKKAGQAGRIALEAVYLNGGSPIGEFFLDSERYWGVQLRLERSNGH